MSVLKNMLTYVMYYIIVFIVVSLFASSMVKDPLLVLCKASLAVSMFASVLQLVLVGGGGRMAERISSWCLRGTAILVGIAVIAGIGFRSIARLIMFM